MKSARGATATGAQATGTAALGSLALGAMALGAMAVGALAIGRLSVGRARLRRVEIGELTVGRLDVGPSGREPGMLTAVARIRAAPGKGDAMARLLLDQSATRQVEPGTLFYPPHRSTSDRDLFLVYEQYVDESAFERHGHTRLDDLRRRVAEQGLAAGSADDAVEVELYHTI